MTTPPVIGPSAIAVPRVRWPGVSAASVQAWLLLAAATWLRAAQLDHVPGINGDEAWSGVQAWRLLHGESFAWRTPTGNIVNPFFLLPLTGLLAIFPATFVLLRVVSLLSGLLALAVNYALCRRAFDARTACLSTVLLAVLPIDIAYSRFGWDASQSLLATVFVLYLPLLAVRVVETGPDTAHRLRLGIAVAAVVALLAAAVVHPTNIFAAPLVAIGLAYPYRRRLITAWKSGGNRVFLATVGLALAAAAWLALAAANRPLHGLESWPAFAAGYLRLFSGATTFDYLVGVGAAAGSQPSAPVWGANAVFAVLVILAWYGMYQRFRRPGGDERDAILVWSWAAMLWGFSLVAGPAALAPHFERYAICLIAPGALLLARGWTWWLKEPSRRSQRVSLALVACGWLWLAIFHGTYFGVIEATGGLSHRAFRTAAEEPKQTALNRILAARPHDATARVVCHEWWNFWPIAYLAQEHAGLDVITWDAWQARRDDGGSAPTWFVEFAGSEGERETLATLERGGQVVDRQVIFDYAGRPLLSVIKASENLSQKN